MIRWYRSSLSFAKPILRYRAIPSSNTLPLAARSTYYRFATERVASESELRNSSGAEVLKIHGYSDKHRSMSRPMEYRTVGIDTLV